MWREDRDCQLKNLLTDVAGLLEASVGTTILMGMFVGNAVAKLPKVIPFRGMFRR